VFDIVLALFARGFAGENRCCFMAQIGVNLHVKRFDKQDAYEDEVIYAQVARRWLFVYPSFSL
jgi:hypothetical protein